MGVTVGPATLEDAAGIARVQNLSWREAYAGLLPDDFLVRSEITADAWRERLANVGPTWAVFVARRDDEIVGFASAGAPPTAEDFDPSDGLLYAIYALPEVWGTGVGRRLHDVAVSALIEMGFDSAVLYVLAGNRRAVDFYVRQGWIADGVERQETMDGQILNEVRYRRPRLAASG